MQMGIPSLPSASCDGAIDQVALIGRQRTLRPEFCFGS